jgi:hypothetical protein
LRELTEGLGKEVMDWQFCDSVLLGVECQQYSTGLQNASKGV